MLYLRNCRFICAADFTHTAVLLLPGVGVTVNPRPAGSNASKHVPCPGKTLGGGFADQTDVLPGGFARRMQAAGGFLPSITAGLVPVAQRCDGAVLPFFLSAKSIFDGRRRVKNA